MRSQRINLVSGFLMIALSFVALVVVIVGYTQAPQPPRSDEGTLAHLFQIAVGLVFPALLLYLATADWARLLRASRPIALAAITLCIAFVMLYRLEHPQ